MRKQGFTIIELLVVLAVIGLVATLAAVAVASARSKQRDATRLSHARQMQSALEDFFVANNAYPEGDGVALGYGEAGCLNADGFQPACEPGTGNILVRAVPAGLVQGLSGASSCGGVDNAYCYSQLSGGESYSLQFELENGLPAAGLAEGLNCASPEGMKAGGCR